MSSSLADKREATRLAAVSLSESVRPGPIDIFDSSHPPESRVRSRIDAKHRLHRISQSELSVMIQRLEKDRVSLVSFSTTRLSWQLAACSGPVYVVLRDRHLDGRLLASQSRHGLAIHCRGPFRRMPSHCLHSCGTKDLLPLAIVDVKPRLAIVSNPSGGEQRQPRTIKTS